MANCSYFSISDRAPSALKYSQETAKLCKGDSRQLSEVSCIDNASTNVLRLRTARPYSEAKLTYLKKLKEAFFHFSLPDNQSAWAMKIYSGIMLHARPVAFNDHELRRRFCDPFASRDAIKKGIEEGYAILRKMDPNAFLKSLKSVDLDLKKEEVSELYTDRVSKLNNQAGRN